MDFTFGIITTSGNEDRVKEIKQSIHDLNIPNYEIIIIGGKKTEMRSNERYESFDEEFKNGWITLKKNIITEYAKYNNVVYTHDYIKFDKDWYKGFLKFNEEKIWEVAMNQIITIDNQRFRDWVTWDDPEMITGTLSGGRKVGLWLVDYDTYKKKEYMYISGAYWVAKKDTMIRYPLDNNICWGQGEDVEWSKRTLPNVSYEMNKYSKVHLMKDKQIVASPMSEFPKKGK